MLDIHTTDSEFNLSPSHTKEVLRALVARRRDGGPLRDLRLWGYLHPVPFDEEMADLMAAAGCKGASISAEHICREHIAVWDAPTGRAGLAYTFADVERQTRMLADRDILMTTELLLGLPGENLDTLRHAIDASLALPTTVVGYTLARPDGRWVRTIEWIQRYVPEAEHHRVALPTVAGDGKDDNNYADNPFLQRAVALGFKGACYSWWRRRKEVMATPLAQST